MTAPTAPFRPPCETNRPRFFQGRRVLDKSSGGTDLPLPPAETDQAEPVAPARIPPALNWLLSRASHRQRVHHQPLVRPPFEATTMTLLLARNSTRPLPDHVGKQSACGLARLSTKEIGPRPSRAVGMRRSRPPPRRLIAVRGTPVTGRPPGRRGQSPAPASHRT